MSTEPPVFTVSQLSHAIKHCLEGTFPLINLQGEISNCKLHTSGHLYFSLKDANAQISAIMYRPDAMHLKTVPKDGMQVIVRGDINVYPQGGKYQIIVRDLRPVGIGELLLKLEELKIKLHKLGWFRSEHKKPLPKLPQRIGVVTSPTGAAIQDMLNILSRRFSGFHLILNPVKVQGEGAGREIAQAIEQFNTFNLVDVMIVGRGGGSIEDLWAFNEEIVAAAIFHSRIPIISAVGHETDHCIADYVADVRAPTPSAAAEIVIAEKSQHLQHLMQTQRRMQQTVIQLIRQDRHRLNGLIRQPLLQSPFGLLGPWVQKLDSLRSDADETIFRSIETYKLKLESKTQQLHSLKPTAKLAHYKQQLGILEKNIKQAIAQKIEGRRIQLAHFKELVHVKWKTLQNHRRAIFQESIRYKSLDEIWQRIIKQKRERFENIKISLDIVNPKNVLTKGYCILFSEKTNSAISSVNEVQKHDDVRILLGDGDLNAIVTGVKPK
ncbi:MAG: exodeoxyribonuclease VII large subunit [Parachlamydiaceae bacterium]|nr:exodeoxyribonuclease VII large subunit [Parachlamydiaceae bacterium]